MSCSGVTVGNSSVSNPDPLHPGTYTTISPNGTATTAQYPAQGLGLFGGQIDSKTLLIGGIALVALFALTGSKRS